MSIPISRDNAEYDRVFGKDNLGADFADGGTDTADIGTKGVAGLGGPSMSSFGTDPLSSVGSLGTTGATLASGMGRPVFNVPGMNYPNPTPFGFPQANPALAAAQQQMLNDPYYFFAWPTWTSGFWGNTPVDNFAGAGADPFSVAASMRNMPPFGGPTQFPGLAPQAISGIPGQFPSRFNQTTTDVSRGPIDSAWSTRDIAKVFPRHVGSRVMVDESGETIWRPSADIFETDNEILVHVDLPGVPKEEVHCDVRGADLIIWGEHKTPYEAASSRVRERNIGKFRKIVTLPVDQVENDTIEAKCENGLLEVKIPKKAEVKGKRISILWP